MAISDTVWLAIIAGAFGLAQYWIKVSQDKKLAIVLMHAEEAAKMAREAAVVNRDTHALVNSKMGIELLAVVQLSEWKKEREPSTENVAAYNLAKANYEEHQRKQLIVDADKLKQENEKGKI